MTNICYVKVHDVNKNTTYDVGPFDTSGNQAFFETSNSAINWIYKQIGIIKTQHPDASLIKHKWSYVIDELLEPLAELKVEIQGFVFEIFFLKSPGKHNVVNEHITNAYPDWL